METSQSLTLELSKDFNTPADKLYQAWVTEDALRQWWHPMKNTLGSLVNELHEGGRIEYKFLTAEGEKAFTITGDYKKAEQGKKLVYSWNWDFPSPPAEDTDFLLTIEFSAKDKGSVLHVQQEGFTMEEAIQPHREGWDTALKNLEIYLEQKGEK